MFQVPRKFRVGPWTIGAKLFVIGAVTAIICTKPSPLLERLEPVYPELFSAWWCYNLLVFFWTSRVLYQTIFRDGAPQYAVFSTYTVQSWSYLVIRHGLTALSPLLNPTYKISSFLLRFNEFLRFPALITATVTFFFWNFMIAPLIYFFVKTPKKRASFVNFSCSFVLIQLHIFNIVFAVLNTVSVSPRRLFQVEDLWCATCMCVGYGCFYLLILDRLGVHFYPILSPRTPYLILIGPTIVMLYYGAYVFWNNVLKKGTLAGQISMQTSHRHIIFTHRN